MTNRLTTNLSANSHDGAFARPLFFAQQRAWFLHQSEPGGNAYNKSKTLLIVSDGRSGAVSLMGHSDPSRVQHTDNTFASRV